MRSMNAEQAKAATDVITAMWEDEFRATCQVLAAVSDDNRGLQAGSEVAHRMGAGDAPRDRRHLVHRQHHHGTVRVEPGSSQAGRRPVRDRVNDVVEFYRKTFPERIKALRDIAGRDDGGDHGFLRHDEDAARAVRRVREQSQHPPPRPARRLPAGAGLEGAEHLRAERRRRTGG